MENLVGIMNRLVESKISFKTAYYSVFGDNVEETICVAMLETGRCSEILKKRINTFLGGE
jgi:hypothetical protein